MSTVTDETTAQSAFEGVPYDEITADAFLGLIETGFFPDEARVFLRDGRIFAKMAKTNSHSFVSTLFRYALVRHLPATWVVVSEGQFKLDLKNSPLPDLTVLRGSAREYISRGRYPESSEVGLIVEIAVTSLAKDLGSNLERYARNLIPTYWVADVPGHRLLAHSSPRVADGRGEYEIVQEIVAGGVLPLVLDGQEVARFTYEDLMP